MKFQIAHSRKTELSSAKAEIKNTLSPDGAKLIIYFATSGYDPRQTSLEMQKAFYGVPTVGCTTSGELSGCCMSDGGLVAMAIGDEVIDEVAIELIPDLSKTETGVETAFARFESHFGEQMNGMDATKYVGLVMSDGLSGKEEELNERIGDLTNVMFVGGSAGDDLAFEKTHVFCNGEAVSNASVLILIKSKVPFDIIKTQSFKPTDKKLTITKADESKRCIMEINGKPATTAYAEALGVDEGNVGDYYFKNPVGLVFDKENIFVRSPQQNEGQKIKFYCSIKEGMELSLLESTDIIEDTKKAVADKAVELDGISGIINFHCILRTLDLKEQGQEQAYADIFKDIPTIGFSTYGESYIGHINQTSTMLAFK